MVRALSHRCCLRHIAPLLAGKRLQFWCDNLSVVSIINSGHSKNPRIMDLVRRVVLLWMKHYFVVRTSHVPGVSNEIADALSRFQMQRFRALATDADQNPCTIPPSLMNLWERKSCGTLPEQEGILHARACVHPLNEDSVGASNLMAGNRKLA